jgi:hypothetical protein
MFLRLPAQLIHLLQFQILYFSNRLVYWKITRWENLTIRQLFSIATEVLRENIDREQQLLNAINCACDVGVKHYQQILEIAERLQYDSPYIQNETLLGISKLKQVKRSADDANINEGSQKTLNWLAKMKKDLKTPWILFSGTRKLEIE